MSVAAATYLAHYPATHLRERWLNRLVVSLPFFSQVRAITTEQLLGLSDEDACG